MKKFLTILLLFWWTFIFPELSFNSLTTEITAETTSPTSFYDAKQRQKLLSNAEYTTWFETIFLSSHK